MRYSVNNIQIRDGSIDFLDGPKEIRHTVREVNVNIPFLSNLPYYVDTYVQPVLEATLNGTPVSFRGKTKPFKDSLETSFDFDIQKFDIPYYLDYVPFPLTIRIPSAFLNSQGTLTFTQYADHLPTLGFAGKVAFDTIEVESAEGNRLLRLPLLDLSISSSELFSREFHFSSILVKSPEIQIRRDKAGRIDLLSLFPDPKTPDSGGKTEEKSKEGEKETPAGIAIKADRIQVVDGSVMFSDISGEKPFRTTLHLVEIEVGNFTNAKQEKSDFALALKTESHETLDMSGNFSVSPLASEGSLKLGMVLPRKYTTYFTEKILFDVAEGKVDLSARYRLARTGREMEANLAGLSVRLRSLRLRKKGEEEDFLSISEVGVKNTAMDLRKRKLSIGRISTRKGAIFMKRPEGKEWNLGTLFSQAPSDGDVPPAGEESQGETPWAIAVKNIRLDEYTFRVEDRRFPEPVSLTADRITFRGENLSTERDRKGRASLTFGLNESGSVSAEGEVGINPVSSRLDLVVKTVGIVALQPYFTEKVNIIVRSGEVFADGTLSVASSEDGDLEAAYTGEASLKTFASVDKEKSDDFLNIASLDLTGMDVGYSPSGTHVEIARAGLTDFYLRFIIYNEGGLNVRRVFKWKGGEGTEGGAGEEQAMSPVAPTKVMVEQVIFQGGRSIFPTITSNRIFPRKCSMSEGRSPGFPRRRDSRRK